MKWTITLKGDGSGDLVGEEHHVGDGAFWLRTALSQADSRLNYVESTLLGDWFPTVAVDKNIDFKGDLPHGEAWVKYKAKSDGLGRHEGTTGLRGADLADDVDWRRRSRRS